MMDLGTVRPGSTILIPFHTFDSNDPSASVTITGLALADIGIYKGTSMTERASTTGVVLLDTDGIDIDTTTGVHGFSIDLSSNATADFYTAGSRYYVTVASITVDAATVNFIAATFEIGYPGAIVNTTIATLASQTSFTLTAASAEADAYNGWKAIVHDIASAVQLCVGYVLDYAVTTKTVTLTADPGIFTMAAGDNISLFPPDSVAAWNSVALATTNPLPDAAPDAAGGLPISDAGGLDLDAKLANTNEVTAARMSELDAGTGGKMANQVDEIRTDTGEIGTAGAGLTDITINSASVDAVWAKTMTELGAVPGVTGTTLAALEWLFLLSRNKGTQNSTTKTLRNDADSADLATSAISDDATTFTRGEWS